MIALNQDYLWTAHTLRPNASKWDKEPEGFDFQTLAPLELVTDQFTGVSFGCAIALIPSNPLFVTKPGRTTIMPTGNDNQLAIALDNTVDAFCLWGRCTKPMMLKVLESNGNVMHIHSYTRDSSPDNPDDPDQSSVVLPLQILRLEDMGNIVMIELSADAPFVIEGFSI